MKSGDTVWRVVIVDDMPELQEGCVTEIRESGYVVMGMRDGKRAMVPAHPVARVEWTTANGSLISLAPSHFQCDTQREAIEHAIRSAERRHEDARRKVCEAVKLLGRLNALLLGSAS